MLLPKKLTPLTYREVISALKSLGFEIHPKGSTAHEMWERKGNGTKFVVTVDKHLAPFSKDLITYMARQAGMKPRELHSLCKKRAKADEFLQDATQIDD